MITGLDHIAIIVSCEESLNFYKHLGFVEVYRELRKDDIMLFLEAYGIRLEMFIKPNNPPRVSNPEALGLRHLALKVDNLTKTLVELGLEAEPIREYQGKHFTFIKDHDGLPIELHD